jgi:DNA-binding transcriptional LysR family regulator
MELGSYHAAVACVAAGVGITIVPRFVLRVSVGRPDVAAHRLPAVVADARTCLVWQRGHRSSALDALRTDRRRRPRRSPESPRG